MQDNGTLSTDTGASMRPLFRRRLRNLGASLFLMAALGGAQASIPYFRHYFSASTVFFDTDVAWWQVLLAANLAYAAVLLGYYLLEPTPGVSKSIHCLRALGRLVGSPGSVWRGGLPPEERLGLLSVALKAFFAPLMVVWLFEHTALMLNHGGQAWTLWLAAGMNWQALFGADAFWFTLKLILFLDVFFFTLGYLIELPALGNQIRSVDPTLLGWGVTLACYPPFNSLTSSVFGWHSTDFPQFAHAGVHWVANVLLLALMGVYSWASVALRFKASNLTHRGIVATGPYRYVRHPAYVCKNLAWWIGLMPALLLALDTSLSATLVTVGSMLGWSVLYYMRAITEEDHLGRVDGDYAAYCARVKYRFVPGVV